MQPDTQQFYALTKLLEAKSTISSTTHEMPELRQKLENVMNVNKQRANARYEELQKLQAHLVDALSLAYRFLLEIEEQRLADYTIKLIASVKIFRIMTPDYSKFCGVLNNYVSRLPSEHQTTNAKIIGRLMNRVKLGYYPTDLEHIQHIVCSIAFPKGVITNLFDPCCGCGLALKALAEGNNCFTYGVELDESRAEEALTRLHRVGFGSFFYSRISNEAFHGMLLNPPYLSVLSEGGENFRSEKRFLVDSLCHLMIDGLLIYIVPYYRLTEDVCRVLCDNLKVLNLMWQNWLISLKIQKALLNYFRKANWIL